MKLIMEIQKLPLLILFIEFIYLLNLFMEFIYLLNLFIYWIYLFIEFIYLLNYLFIEFIYLGQIYCISNGSTPAAGRGGNHIRPVQNCQGKNESHNR